MTGSKLTAETGANAFAARSLDDTGLRRFLRENLGHEPETWDFEALCWVAFYYHPSLELARAQWATARADLRTAGERPNPTLTLTPGFDFTHQAGVSPWMPGVGLDWLFQRGAARSHQVRRAELDAEAARLSVLSGAWDVRAELRRALVDAEAAARREQVAEQQVGAQRELLTLIAQRFEAGSVTAVDVSNVRSAALRAEAAAAEAARQTSTARTRVAMALGLPSVALDQARLPVPPVPRRLSAAELQAARTVALHSRADVLAALAKYASAQEALELEVAKRFPDLHFGPAYQWDQGLSKWSLGISFELPIFNRHEGAIDAALARRAEAIGQFNAVQNKVVAAIDGAIAGLEIARAQSARVGQLIAEAEKQVNAARAQLEAGAGDRVQLETAQLDLATAESARLEADLAQQTAAGELEDALQIPFANLTALAAPARVIGPSP